MQNLLFLIFGRVLNTLLYTWRQSFSMSEAWSLSLNCMQILLIMINCETEFKNWIPPLLIFKLVTYLFIFVLHYFLFQYSNWWSMGMHFFSFFLFFFVFIFYSWKVCRWLIQDLYSSNNLCKTKLGFFIRFIVIFVGLSWKFLQKT